MNELLKSANNGKRRKGQNHLINHYRGEKLTRQQAIFAKCYDCNGMGESTQCDIKDCPLYPYSQYRI